MKNQTIAKFNLPVLESASMIQYIVSEGYHKTGRKFTVEFNGSKGYLDHIRIYCESYGLQQGEDNIIDLGGLRTKQGQLKSKLVTVSFNAETGVRVEVAE